MVAGDRVIQQADLRSSDSLEQTPSMWAARSALSLADLKPVVRPECNRYFLLCVFDVRLNSRVITALFGPNLLYNLLYNLL